MTTTPHDNQDAIRETVRQHYGAAARASTSCCAPSCCSATAPRDHAQAIGYTPEQLDAAPEGANLGLGCGNPTALAELRPGQVVLDLGSGAGLDAVLAAQAVGPTGRVIGVDMTPEMLARARTSAETAGVSGWTEFRVGLIEALPVESGSVDVILSNCVINLSPDKPRVFQEAFRVLAPGGRLAVSDILLSEPLPADIASLAEAWVACVGGASVEEAYLDALRAAGFVDIAIERTSAAPLLEGLMGDPMVQGAVATLGMERVLAAARTIFSAKILATRP